MRISPLSETWSLKYPLQFSFWEILSGQAEDQGASERTARGRRAELFDGGKMDGFAGLVEDLLVVEGVPVVQSCKTVLPKSGKQLFPFNSGLKDRAFCRC